MPKQKIQTAVPELPAKKVLTPGESMAFVLAGHELQTAKMTEAHMTAVLRAQELEAHIALTATKQQLEKAKKDVEQAAAKHKRLADHLAATHKFDWAHSAFDPTTGQIEDLPPQ